MRSMNLRDLSDDVEPLLALSAATRTYIEKFDNELKAIAHDIDICRRFLEIPGVGPLCALSLYSTVEDPTRFRRTAGVGAYLGLTPTIRQSGQLITKQSISKMGDAMTRSYLAQAALSHLRYGNSSLTVWGGQLRLRRGKGRAQIAVARKLAVMMVAMWKSNERYDPQRGLIASMSPAADG
jgi:transposase